MTPETIVALLRADNEKLALLALLMGLLLLSGMLSFMIWASRTLIPILRDLRAELARGSEIDQQTQQSLVTLRREIVAQLDANTDAIHALSFDLIAADPARPAH
jgi:hypothetical protein